MKSLKLVSFVLKAILIVAVLVLGIIQGLEFSIRYMFAPLMLLIGLFILSFDVKKGGLFNFNSQTTNAISFIFGLYCSNYYLSEFCYYGFDIGYSHGTLLDVIITLELIITIVSISLLITSLIIMIKDKNNNNQSNKNVAAVNAGEQLAILKDLKSLGVLTDEEYEEKRKSYADLL